MGAVKGKQLETIACPLCSTFSSKRLTAFEAHLVAQHATTTQRLWDECHGGPVFCACNCGDVTRWLGWLQGYAKTLKGHNGSIYALYDEATAREIAQKRSLALVGQPGWSKGLTKETDDRVRLRAEATSVGRKLAFDNGDVVIWSKGLTKETDNRVATAANTLKEMYADGTLRPWSEGQTKATDPRVAAMAATMSLTHKRASLRSKLDEQKRLKLDEITARVEDSGKLILIDGGSDTYVNDNIATLRVRCKTCSNEWTSTLRRLQYGRCFFCDPGGSIAQHEVAAFVRSLGVEVSVNRRDVIQPHELDIFVSAWRFAIEYNGLYWHSLQHKSDTYHQSKTDKCRDADVSLFHIFEDEWRDKRLIVESMIKHRLGLTRVKIGARKCELVELSVAERRAFFNANHIDGDTNAKVAFGLRHGDQIVAAMSLRTPFHRKHRASLEVARFSNMVDATVPGGLSRLTKASRNNAQEGGYSSLLSYVDTRLGTREGWDAAGWKKTGETTSRFWWTDFYDRFNRFKFKADRARGLTEAQVAEAANVVRIYGCKNLTYEATT
jgi:hypothetical protein